MLESLNDKDFSIINMNNEKNNGINRSLQKYIANNAKDTNKKKFL